MSVTFSPRVVGRQRPDYHCLETILASPQFAGRTGERLALAIYDFFTSRIDGTYHFWSPDEVHGNPRIRRVVYDPVKQLNCYGFGLCGQCAHILYGLYATGGMTPGLIGIPGHSLCEVFYEGRWHILDVDMWTWFRTPQGHIASAAELARNHTALILDNTDKSDPCNLPDRSLEDYAGMYAKTATGGDRPAGGGSNRDPATKRPSRHGGPATTGRCAATRAVRSGVAATSASRLDGSVCPDWRIRAHTMDFHLRPGETLIRSQMHEGRFHMPPTWVALAEKHAREWKGTPRERYEPFRTFGNGRWTYEPDLTADLAAHTWGLTDLAQDGAGLVGPGSAIFRIASPYPFCGVPTVDGERITYSDGVWLWLAGAGGVRAEITDGQGRWVEVLAGEGDFDRRVDITRQLSSRYDCLIRLTLADAAKLTGLGFDGRLMTAPMSIPRLVEGDNPMELRCGDKHGFCTEPWARRIDFRAGADLPAQWAEADNAEAAPYRGVEGWQVIAPAGEGPVRLVFRFRAPPGGEFAWAYAHASLREGPPNEPRRAARLEWSDDGRSWRDLGAGEISNTQRQWDCSIDGEAVFPAPLTAAHLRITSETPVSGFEFHGHVLRPAAGGERLRITHRWREAGAERSFEAPAGATEYVVTCGADPTDHTIEMHVPAVGT